MPIEDSPVRRHQSVTIQGRGDDEPVGRIRMEIRQFRCADSGFAVNGDFPQSLTEQPLAPCSHVLEHCDPTFHQQ